MMSTPPTKQPEPERVSKDAMENSTHSLSVPAPFSGASGMTPESSPGGRTFKPRSASPASSDRDRLGGGRIDEAALESLVHDNVGWLRGWFRGRIRDPEIVDDLCQESLLRALRGFSRLRNPARFSAWLYRTAENLLRDHFRKKRRRGDKVVFTDELEGEDSGLKPDERLVQREEAEALLEQIEALPPLYREPLLLRHAQDLPYSEISELLGISENSVRVRIFRARQLLRAKCCNA